MVKGISDLNKKVAQLPRRIEAAARAAMETGADELVDMMKRLVPVDSGDLRNSIGWTWGNAPKGAKVISQSDPDARGLRITIYAGNEKAYYAAWVEFGVEGQTAGQKITNKAGRTRTSRRTTKGGKAQPFFFPSYRALRKRIRDRIRRETRKAMKFQGPPIAAEAD
jgi:HK97 gp10 family phage protein